MRLDRRYSWMIQPKLTIAQVIEIKQVYTLADRLRRRAGKKIGRKGLSKDLAEKYGVSMRCIQHIRTGDRWALQIGRKRRG